MLRDIVARRGIQAVQLTYENRYEIVELVHGRLHQHGQIDRWDGSLMSFTFEIELPNGHLVRQGQWIMITPEGAVSILDDDTFRAWFAVADHLQIMESRHALPPGP